MKLITKQTLAAEAPIGCAYRPGSFRQEEIVLMTHISPLKKLFRRQKALRGVANLLDDKGWERVLRNVLVRTYPEWIIPPPGYSATELDFMRFVRNLFDESAIERART